LTERLSTLLDALPAGVVVLDDGGSVVQINPAAEEFLGKANLGDSWMAIYGDTLIPGETPGEFIARNRHLAVDVTPLGATGGRIVLLHDITEAQELKEQAERTQRLAAMGEMAAQLAHQLRTPLAAALLYAGNLENPELPGASRGAMAQKTVARLKHIEHLIQDMLLFARGEAMGQERFAVAELLAELAQNFEPLLARTGSQLLVRDDTGEVRLTGTRKSLVSALTSLLENALQAVDGLADARIELAARRDDSIVRISVRDNGPGMEKATADRLFQPFFTTRSDGTGLGLAIAHGVVRAHGGSIDVVSSPGGGAEFTVSLPCRNN
jgi:two-component system sensor histidine kinase FlrB